MEVFGNVKEILLPDFQINSIGLIHSEAFTDGIGFDWLVELQLASQVLSMDLFLVNGVPAECSVSLIVENRTNGKKLRFQFQELFRNDGSGEKYEIASINRIVDNESKVCVIVLLINITIDNDLQRCAVQSKYIDHLKQALVPKFYVFDQPFRICSQFLPISEYFKDSTGSQWCSNIYTDKHYLGVFIKLCSGCPEHYELHIEVWSDCDECILTYSTVTYFDIGYAYGKHECCDGRELIGKSLRLKCHLRIPSYEKKVQCMESNMRRLNESLTSTHTQLEQTKALLAATEDQKDSYGCITSEILLISNITKWGPSRGATYSKSIRDSQHNSWRLRVDFEPHGEQALQVFVELYEASQGINHEAKLSLLHEDPCKTKILRTTRVSNRYLFVEVPIVITLELLREGGFLVHDSIRLKLSVRSFLQDKTATACSFDEDSIYSSVYSYV